MRSGDSEHTQASDGIGWGVAAGLAGSLCCLGPAAAALLGLGASSALAAFQLGRGPALALAIGLLGLGLAFAVRRSTNCGLRGYGRLRAPLVTLAAFGLSYALLALALPTAAAREIAASPAALASSAPASFAPGAPASAAPAEQRRLILSISKMECPPCVAKVHQLLSAQPGVVAFVAVADLDEVTIDYRPAVVDDEALFRLFPPSYGVTLLGDAPIP